VNRDREAQAHVHAGRVCLDRGIDKFLELGEIDDLVEAVLDLALAEAEHDAVDEDVFASLKSPDENRRRARSAPRCGRRRGPSRSSAW
jgi:hypothetical protein